MKSRFLASAILSLALFAQVQATVYPPSPPSPPPDSLPSSPILPSQNSPTVSEAYRPKAWDNLGSNLIWSLIGWPLAAHATGAASTWVLLDQGVDAAGLRMARRQSPTLDWSLYGPGLLVGSFAPIILPTSLYVLPGRASATGAVALQSVGIAFLYNNALKAATGRKPPTSNASDPEGLAHGFRFGFMRGGLFNGWPSGHAMTNSSLAAGLASYHRDTPWAVPVSLAYSAYIGGCVTFGAQGDIHWVSDTVAGLLMGYAIGWTVGSGFHRDRVAKGAKPPAVSFHPLMGEAVGLGVTARLE